MKKEKRSSFMSGVIAALVLVLIDRVTKIAAVSQLKGKDPFVIIDGVFELHYLQNTGAAFGIMQGRQSFFYIITVAVLAVIVYIYFKMPSEKKFRFLKIILVFIFSGALGNFIDRAAQGYVVDFFYFSLIDFPIFNVADIYVTCSTILLIILVLFYYKDDDLGKLMNSLKPFGGKRKESDGRR